MGSRELLVLAGGLGTRLRTVVTDVPKPLAPIDGTPFLQFLIENWLEQGIDSFCFLTSYKSGAISDFLQSAELRALLKHCRIRTVTEEKPLGTGGAVTQAVIQEKIQGHFLVANADTWLGGDITQLIQAQHSAIATVSVEDTSRYGSLDIENGQVVAFNEKASAQGAGWINAGMYNLHSSLFQDTVVTPFSLEQTILPHLAETGALAAVSMTGDFIDIGIPDDYFRFCRWIESGRQQAL